MGLSSAVLRVHARTTATTFTDLQVWTLDHANWNSTSLTLANKPTPLTQIGSVPNVVAGNWYELDISSALSGYTGLATAYPIAFALQTTATATGQTLDSLASSTYAPYISVVYSLAAKPGSTCAPTASPTPVPSTGTPATTGFSTTGFKVTVEFTMGGLSIGAFNDTTKASFRSLIATRFGLSVSQVRIVSVSASRRAGTTVKFEVSASSQSNADTLKTSIKSFIEDTGSSGFASSYASLSVIPQSQLVTSAVTVSS